MAVHELDALHRGHHRQVDGHRLQRRGLRLRFRELCPRLVGGHPGLVARSAPAFHGHLGQVAKLAREVLDVRAGSAVDLGRILPREQRDPVLYRSIMPGPTSILRPVPDRKVSIAVEASSSRKRLVIIASQSITPLTSSESARSKLCRTAIEPMILISSL